MPKGKRAVFLAAGKGTRMAPLTDTLPKPLVKVHGRPIIVTLLDAVQAAGIEEIYIVRGYLGEKFDCLLKDYPQIRFIDNPDYDKANNTSSIVAAAAYLENAYIIEIIVDTTSTLAMLPIDVEQENIDFCMASAQKGIQAMTGLSYVIGRTAIIEASKDYPIRSYYCNLYMQYDYFRKTGQMHFTPPVQTIYSVRQALKEYFAEGEQAKWQRHQAAMAEIHKGLQELGMKEVVPQEIQSGLVVAVAYPDNPQWDFNKVHDYCYERGFTIYPGKMQNQGTFRLCVLGAITAEDIKAFFKVFREALKK